ncbi:MAG: hypothetical protein WA040_12630 [Anaerolineae bacterium]
MFEITLTPSAFDDLYWFRMTDRRIILDGIEEQLSHQPHIVTRNRKRLRPTRVAEWELRIDKFRVFYDLSIVEQWVEVKMVGHKLGNRLVVRGQEYEL